MFERTCFQSQILLQLSGLHGGVPDLPGVSGPKGEASIARLGFGRIRARQEPDSESFGEPNLAL